MVVIWDNAPSYADCCSLNAYVGGETIEVTVSIEKVDSESALIQFKISLDSGATWSGATNVGTIPKVKPILIRELANSNLAVLDGGGIIFISQNGGETWGEPS